MSWLEGLSCWAARTTMRQRKASAWGVERAGEGFEFGSEFGLQFDDGSEGARHGCPPGSPDWVPALENIMANHAPFG
jgi:hypothetical protein